MPSEERDRDLRESSRSSVAVEVNLQFSDSEEMVATTANLSRGGMFVPLRPPRPVGTLMRLAISLPDSDEEVKGYGEVVWIRVRDESSHRSAGMGVRFRHLEGDGGELLSQRLPALEAAEEEMRRAQVATPVPEEDADATLSFPPAPPPASGARPEVEFPSRPLWEEAPPAGPGEWPPEASPAAGGWSSSGEAAPPLAEAEAEPAPRRRLSRGMVIASAALLAVALVAFFLREPLVRWIVGGGGVAESGSVSPAATAGEEAPAGSGEEAGAEAMSAGAGAPPAGEGAPPPDDRSPAVAGPAGSPPAVSPALSGAPAPPAGSLSEIREIAWWGVEGETLVVITGDGAIPREQVTRQRVGGGRPRELLRIAGVTRPYRQAEIPVGTPEVTRIRTGYHPESGGGELYVVFDLASPRAAVDRIETLATGIRVYLRKSGP